jgi:rhamnulokinase
MDKTFLAFDLGAESGRAILGTMARGVLELREIRRFANEPVRSNGSLHWDALRLWHEMVQTLASDALPPLASVAVDGWGVDYALLGERGNLLENPYHYRDRRNDGMMQAVFERATRERIYSVTGIQFLQINTLFQLYAACSLTPEVVDAARALVTIPDLFNYWLSGRICSEYTVATTTQFVDARSRTWATRLLDEIGLPTRLLPEMVQPGSIIGSVRSQAIPSIAGVPVVAPACHDTGSAVASVHTGGKTAFISSGTWSLLGTELAAPIITATARDLNFTNEGGVGGTIRLLKNIGGLWLLQACRRAWAKTGGAMDYDTLLASASDELAFASLIDPDYQGFLNPEDMPNEIARYCRRTSQREPATAAAYARTILESLALKYRVVLESLEQITELEFDEIRIVGGGSRNRLLNQLTADATGRPVLAGPVEATALGNIALQMVATGAVESLTEARDIVERSFPIERFEPRQTERWDAPYRRFLDYLEFTCA